MTQKAIEYHTLHENLADINGKFLASINLGLCFDRLGDSKKSIFWFQSALKHSVQMANLSGQSLAIGNIGKIGNKSLSENKDKMKIFVEKYLKLAKRLVDKYEVSEYQRGRIYALSDEIELVFGKSQGDQSLLTDYA